MRVSERSILVTVVCACVLAGLTVLAPWLILVLVAVFCAPFVYLWASWKRDTAKRRKERFWA